MKDKERFDKFFEIMYNEIEGHNGVYGDSWKEKTPEYMLNRMEHKLDEYKLTKNPKKLVSLANLSMLLYVRSVKTEDVRT